MPHPPEMGPIPKAQICVRERPFTCTGVDYFGPFYITVGGRHEKWYGVLFTCLMTHALHLELAGSLSSDACVMAIRQLICYRGSPREIYSDNGANFQGAHIELKKALAELNQEWLTASVWANPSFGISIPLLSSYGGKLGMFGEVHQDSINVHIERSISPIRDPPHVTCGGWKHCE